MFNGGNIYKSVAAVIVQPPWVVGPWELGEGRERFLELGDRGDCAKCEGLGLLKMQPGSL